MRWPMKPAPTITTSSPRPGAARSTAFTAQPSGSARASSSGTSRAGRQCAAGRATRSANPRAVTQPATGSPGARPRTRSPVLVTTPLTSWPGYQGSAAAERPEKMSSSDAHTPQAATRSSTSSGPMAGSGSSARSNRPGSFSTAIFIPGSALHPGRGDALDEVPLEDEEHDDDRRHRDHRAGHEQIPDRPVLLRELTEPDRHSGQAGRGEDTDSPQLDVS